MRAEAEVAGAPTGGMDQMVAMLAQPDAALLIDFGDHVDGARCRSTWPTTLLLVTDTRVSHALTTAATPLGGPTARRPHADSGVPTLRAGRSRRPGRLADPRQRRRAHHVVTEIERVGRAVLAVKAADWTALGRLLLASHASLRDDFEVSCAELDTAVAAAVDAGARGARMTGGGFGGSTVALLRQGEEEAVAEAIDAAFARAGLEPPRHLVATPSAAAGLV